MFKKTILPLVLVFASGAANAGIVTNDTDILTGDDHAQLSEWLGYDFDLTRIFAKGIDGDDGYSWHAAVDGKGPTFTTMEVFDNDTNERRVIGGYTDISWESNSDHGESYKTFLFNLTNSMIFERNNRVRGGEYATFNAKNWGASFGLADFRLYDDLTTGYSNLGNIFGEKTGYGDADYQALFTGSNSNWTVGSYETFTLSASTGNFGEGAVANVPVTFLLGGLGLFGLMASRRKIQ